MTTTKNKLLKYYLKSRKMPFLFGPTLKINAWLKNGKKYVVLQSVSVTRDLILKTQTRPPLLIQTQKHSFKNLVT